MGFVGFCEHGMKVNETKTELMVMGTEQMLRGITGVDVRFNQEIISPSNHVRNLGVIFDRSLWISNRTSINLSPNVSECYSF